MIAAAAGLRLPGVGDLLSWVGATDPQAAELVGRCLDWNAASRLATTERPPASRLTPTGSAIEFGVVSGHPGLKLAVEVDRPDRPVKGRLGRAALLAASLGVELPDVLCDCFGDGIEPSSPGAGLWWGAFVDGRETRHKVYLETAGGANGALMELPGYRSLCDSHLPAASQLVMIGYDPVLGSWEYYFRTCEASPLAFQNMYAALGKRKGWAGVMGILSSLYRFPLRRRMPAKYMGFSWRFRADGESPVGSVYCPAWQVNGDIPALLASLEREVFAGHADRKWYALLASRMSTDSDQRWSPGMLGLHVDGEEQTAVSLTAAPPLNR